MLCRNKVEYRKAALDEADRICYIVQHTKAEIYPDYYTQAVVDFFSRLHSIDNIIKDIEHKRIDVLTTNGEIIGTGSHTDNHITRVYVLPEYQGQGFGSVIMNELEKEIFASYDYCELDASLPACIFYENKGYKTVKHIKYDIGNGAVKTTLIKLICGLYTPTSGYVRVFGEEPFFGKTNRHNIGLVTGQVITDGYNYHFGHSISMLDDELSLELNLELRGYFCY